MRDKSIDIAKGLAIILVMVGHTLMNRYVCNAIYSFHMPLFFILSGYFMNGKSIDRNYINKLYKTLLRPYLITALITIGLSFFCNHNVFNDIVAAFIVGCDISYIDIPFIGAIWFLIALFLSKLIIQLVINGILKWEYLLFLTMVSYFVTKMTGVILPWCLSIVGFCSLFVLIGHFLGKKNILIILSDKHYFRLIALWCLLFAPFVPLAVRINFYPLGLFNILTASTLTVSILVLIKFFLNEVRIEFISDFFSWLGRNSLLILCIHSVECHFHLLDITLNDYYNCVIRIIVVVILTFFLYKVSIVKCIFNTK